MTDRQLRHNIQDALEWEPSIDAAEIGVSVENGVVALRGDVRSYSERAAAEHVTLAVYGVKAVANDLEVRLRNGQERPTPTTSRNRCCRPSSGTAVCPPTGSRRRSARAGSR